MPPRFLCRESLTAGSMVNLTAEEAHHIVHVLRMNVGERVALIDGNGIVADAEITVAGKKSVQCRILAISHSTHRSRISLAFGIAKPAALEWIFRKCTEVGIRRFTPLITEHSLSMDRWNAERWEKIILEACKQSQEVFIPELMPPIKFSAWLANPHSTLVVCDEAERHERASSQLSGEIELVVGAEGGWSISEREQLVKAGALRLGLGANRLRAETAALVGLVLLKARTEEI